MGESIRKRLDDLETAIDRAGTADDYHFCGWDFGLMTVGEREAFRALARKAYRPTPFDYDQMRRDLEEFARQTLGGKRCAAGRDYQDEAERRDDDDSDDRDDGGSARRRFTMTPAW